MLAPDHYELLFSRITSRTEQFHRVTPGGRGPEGEDRGADAKKRPPLQGKRVSKKQLVNREWWRWWASRMP